MGKQINVTLPLPPPLRNAYINKGMSNKRIRTAECKDYIEYVGLMLNTKRIKTLPYVPMITINFYWPDRRTRDWDNYLKVLFDALKGKLFIDDRWMILPKCNIRNALDKDNPRVEIIIDMEGD